VSPTDEPDALPTSLTPAGAAEGPTDAEREKLASNPQIRPNVPHSARVWNFWLGGKDNFEADRMMAGEIGRLIPGAARAAREDRGFLGRAVRYLVGEAGIRQFLDIGTGLPTADNTHEVAQRGAPDARIVYVDNDPIVLAHARALLTSTPKGVTRYIDADLNDPGQILEQADKTLDFSKPVAVMLLGVLNHIEGYERARGIARQLVEAVPEGSYLAIAHPTDAVHGKEAMQEVMRQYREAGGRPPLFIRSRDQVAGFFAIEGLELLEPGVVSCPHWRPESTAGELPEPVFQFCGVARKAGGGR
jgi:hypothetical protein